MVMMKHPNSGIVKEVPTGFSWTTFFFGWLVPAVRGCYGYSCMFFLATLCTAGIAQLVYPFFVNKHYIQSLLEKGYKPCSENDVLVIQAQGIMYTSNEKKIAEAA